MSRSPAATRGASRGEWEPSPRGAPSRRATRCMSRRAWSPTRPGRSRPITSRRTPPTWSSPAVAFASRGLPIAACRSAPWRSSPTRCAMHSAGAPRRRPSSPLNRARVRRFRMESSPASRRPATTALPARRGRQAATRRTCESTPRHSASRSSNTWSCTTVAASSTRSFSRARSRVGSRRGSRAPSTSGLRTTRTASCATPRSWNS